MGLGIDIVIECQRYCWTWTSQTWNTAPHFHSQIVSWSHSSQWVKFMHYTTLICILRECEFLLINWDVLNSFFSLEGRFLLTYFRWYLSDSLLTSVAECLFWDPIYHQLYKCLMAAHTMQSFQDLFWELVLQCILPSLVHHELCNYEAGLSTLINLVHGTS